MKNDGEIQQELIDAFDNKVLKKTVGTGLRVDGQLLSERDHFGDYIRIGVLLSEGPRAIRSGLNVVESALLMLENDMVSRIGKFYSKSQRAVDYFNSRYDGNKKDVDYSRLLSGALNDFEKNHGFLVTGDKVPNYVGFVFGNVFKEALRRKHHWKDVGAGASHGEYTHRLQWYILIHANILQSVARYNEATLFQSIEPWQKGETNLWTFLFDLLADSESIAGDKLDFRSPENLNLWLVDDARDDFCPVLRSFLVARKKKREINNTIKYLAKKIRIDEKAASLIMDGILQDTIDKKNPSLRVEYPSGERPKISPYAQI